MEHETKKEFDADDIIENFGDLPAEERARLVARQEANEWAAIERKKQELEQLHGLNEQLRAHLERRREFARWLEELVTRAEHEDALLREEKEQILAAA